MKNLEIEINDGEYNFSIYTEQKSINIENIDVNVFNGVYSQDYLDNELINGYILIYIKINNEMQAYKILYPLNFNQSKIDFIEFTKKHAIGLTIDACGNIYDLIIKKKSIDISQMMIPIYLDEYKTQVIEFINQISIGEIYKFATNDLVKYNNDIK